MDITIQPGLLHGSVAAIPSKSQAHRLLICSAFAEQPTFLKCPQLNQDILATMRCLRALGADIVQTAEGLRVRPISAVPESAELNCGESGSTLRFFLPVAGALGVDAIFQMTGRLPQRPLSPLWEEMERMGCALSRPAENVIRCTGKLRPGAYTISGSVSSQFVTGLLYALSLLKEESSLTVSGKVESLPYIQMTLSALETFGICIPEKDSCYTVTPQAFRSPGNLTVEGDWSNAAFWLAARAMGSDITVTNLNFTSDQGDRMVTRLLKELEQHCVVDAAQIPDLVPVLAVVAGARQGAVFTNAARLRLKETDRLVTTAALINGLGGSAQIVGDELVIGGTGYRSGTVDAANDHRIAMAAAVAATVASGAVTIRDADAVKKSYPRFWEDYRSLGGKI